MIKNKNNILFQTYRCLLLSVVLATITLPVMSCGDDLLNTETRSEKSNSEYKLTLTLDPDIVYLNSNTQVTVTVERLVHRDSVSTNAPSSLKLSAVGGSLQGNVEYNNTTIYTPYVTLDNEVGAKFEVLAFYIPKSSYSTAAGVGYYNYVENGHVSALYDGLNVTLPVRLVKPR